MRRTLSVLCILTLLISGCVSVVESMRKDMREDVAWLVDIFGLVQYRLDEMIGLAEEKGDKRLYMQADHDYNAVVKACTLIRSTVYTEAIEVGKGPVGDGEKLRAYGTYSDCECAIKETLKSGMFSSNDSLVEEFDIRRRICKYESQRD